MSRLLHSKLIIQLYDTRLLIKEEAEICLDRLLIIYPDTTKRQLIEAAFETNDSKVFSHIVKFLQKKHIVFPLSLFDGDENTGEKLFMKLFDNLKTKSFGLKSSIYHFINLLGINFLAEFTRSKNKNFLEKGS